MGLWNRLFGGVRTPAEATPSPVAGPSAVPAPAAVVLPLEEADVGRLAELFLRSYLILTGQAQGSRQQAKAFDDWLESYRNDPNAIIARAAQFPGCPEAEVRIPPGGVLWWEIPDPQVRFLCSFCGTSGYAIPRKAAPVPLIPEFTPPAVPVGRIVSIRGNVQSVPAQPAGRLSALREKLRDENILVRMEAVNQLEQDGSPSALPGIREAMGNDHVAVRIQAGYVLGRLTEAIVPAWARPFDGGAPEAQAESVRKLGDLAVLHAAAVPELVEVVLTDPHLAAVTYAVTGLCMIAQKAAIAPVLSIDVLRSPNSAPDLFAQVDRLAAAGVAGVLGLEAARGCPAAPARQDVENTLGAVSRFREQLMRIAWLLHPKRKEDGDAPPPTDPAEVAQAVDGLSSGRADVRSSYVLWLALRDPVVVGPHARRIAGLLRDPDEEVPRCAALALGSLGRFAALGVLGLRAALTSPDAKLRQQAALALGSIGLAAGLAVPALSAAAAADPDPEVRQTARQAAARIGPAFAPACMC